MVRAFDALQRCLKVETGRFVDDVVTELLSRLARLHLRFESQDTAALPLYDFEGNLLRSSKWKNPGATR